MIATLGLSRPRGRSLRTVGWRSPLILEPGVLRSFLLSLLPPLLVFRFVGGKQQSDPADDAGISQTTQGGNNPGEQREEQRKRRRSEERRVGKECRL